MAQKFQTSLVDLAEIKERRGRPQEYDQIIADLKAAPEGKALRVALPQDPGKPSTKASKSTPVRRFQMALVRGVKGSFPGHIVHSQARENAVYLWLEPRKRFRHPKTVE